MTNTIRSLKQNIESLGKESGYQNWLENSSESLNELSIEDWKQIAELLNEDSDWASERFEAWSVLNDEIIDEDEDEEVEDQNQEEE